MSTGVSPLPQFRAIITNAIAPVPGAQTVKVTNAKTDAPAFFTTVKADTYRPGIKNTTCNTLITPNWDFTLGGPITAVEYKAIADAVFSLGGLRPVPVSVIPATTINLFSKADVEYFINTLLDTKYTFPVERIGVTRVADIIYTYVCIKFQEAKIGKVGYIPVGHAQYENSTRRDLFFIDSTDCSSLYMIDLNTYTVVPYTEDFPVVEAYYV